MSSNTPLLLYALLAVVALIVLIARFKVHPFVALISVSLALGIAAGMPLGSVVKAIQDGVGTVLGFIAIVVALGTMLGKLMAESGGATRIATTLIAVFGERRVHWALMFVGFIVGIPVFFQVGFVLLIPLVFTIARRTGLSLVKIGIPLVAGLSVVHGMVPPHPAAMLAVGAYQADVGRTIAYALLVGLPTAALAGPVFATWIAPRITLPAENPIEAQFIGNGGSGGGVPREMPSFGISLFTVLLPVILMVCTSIGDVALDPGSPLRAALDFVGNPIVALLLALLFSFWSLGYRQHFTRDQILKFANDCLGPTATILLIIGAGGGFNRVLIESGVGKAIADVALGSHASPLLLAWSVAALIRVATGSATVAMTTSAGIVAPIAAATPGTSPELLVLATGAGSLVLSHVNDAGFWLIKEFFNMTVPQTLKTWTVAETIIGVAGLFFTLLLSLLVGGCARPDAPWIDVTATLDPGRTRVYEGDAPMKFDFLKDMRRGDKFTLSVYSMGAHSGTHLDAPMHFIANGAPVDHVPLEPLIGPARVIDIPDSIQAIDAAELNRHDWRNAKRVLFRTRSSLRGWMDSSTFHRDFAYVAPDAAQLLADAGVVLVGVDYISAEQFGAPAPRTHQILLGRGIPIVEGLDLRPVQAGDYDFIVLPIKVRGHEGAPARAIARKRGGN
jgi:GntP family gluconate:H+ symporter